MGTFCHPWKAECPVYCPPIFRRISAPSRPGWPCSPQTPPPAPNPAKAGFCASRVSVIRAELGRRPANTRDPIPRCLPGRCQPPKSLSTCPRLYFAGDSQSENQPYCPQPERIIGASRGTGTNRSGSPVIDRWRLHHSCRVTPVTLYNGARRSASYPRCKPAQFRRASVYIGSCIGPG